MKNYCFIPIFAFLLLSPGTVDARQGNEPIHDAYNLFREAIRNGDGMAAATYVTPNTLALYERCRLLALDSSEADFETVSQIEVLMIFQLRWLLSRSQLSSMDGKGLFAWGVENGLLKKESLDAIEIDNVQIEGARAMASLLNMGQPVPDLVFDFELHDGVWKFDYERIFDISNAAFVQVREESGRTKIELAVYLLEKTHNQKIPPQILNGPLK